MGSSQPQHHDPNRDPIEQFIDLVRGGTTIQLAADTVGIPHYLAYRTAHNHDLPFQRHRTPQHMRDYVTSGSPPSTTSGWNWDSGNAPNTDAPQHIPPDAAHTSAYASTPCPAKPPSQP